MSKLHIPPHPPAAGPARIRTMVANCPPNRKHKTPRRRHPTSRQNKPVRPAIGRGLPQRFLLRNTLHSSRVTAKPVPLPKQDLPFAFRPHSPHNTRHEVGVSTAFRRFRDHAGGDCFVATLLAMTHTSPRCHCERSEATYSRRIYETRYQPTQRNVQMGGAGK